MSGNLPSGVTQDAIDEALEQECPTPEEQELDAAEAAGVEVSICGGCYEYVDLSQSHGREFEMGHSKVLCWDCLIARIEEFICTKRSGLNPSCVCKTAGKTCPWHGPPGPADYDSGETMPCPAI